MEIKSFRDLRVWQDAMDVAVLVYFATEEFPKREVFGLASQMRRAAVSISSNIAEGHSRETTREYMRFVSIAQGSSAELDTQVELARRLNLISVHTAEELAERCAHIGRQLYRLRDALAKRLAKPECFPGPDPEPLAPSPRS